MQTDHHKMKIKSHVAANMQTAKQLRLHDITIRQKLKPKNDVGHSYANYQTKAAQLQLRKCI